MTTQLGQPGQLRQPGQLEHLDVRADLDLEVEVPGGGPVRATLRGSGRRLDLRVDSPAAFAGRGDAPTVRAIADGLARHGLTVRVSTGSTHLITLGVARSPWWHRRLTGSAHIRLGSARGLWTSARSRARSVDEPVLPDLTLTPPGTTLPLLPTFLRRPYRRPTTTHAQAGGGDPRLVLAPGEHPWPGDRQPFFRLRRKVTSIGSGEHCDIRLPGLAERHAEIVHDDRDEYVVVAHDPDTRVNGERIGSALLRTATRLEVAGWTLTFSRQEHADHGRPYGGRVGGEAGHQRSQPSRPAARGPESEIK
ncbi:FHA domain-containing protein [Nocardioides mesophilus]|uniref:FHA domain-containing protein n=1 Tax=Nocardioides mesophilus TaxID=433659 RepID=A0A7G9R6V0_9ACTN|nr:FHA domain-containing protein [Nocardioides mesophilus]QNN51325.1 FHA domain-containing protein [Nocardioides mesophilus]